VYVDCHVTLILVNPTVTKVVKTILYVLPNASNYKSKFKQHEVRT